MAELTVRSTPWIESGDAPPLPLDRDPRDIISQAVADPVMVRAHTSDGRRVRRGDVLMTVSGPLTAILTAERTALNLLCHLSGVATLTRRWADAVDGTGARIRDTRKTLPGLRRLEKYAVRCGGGVNHRMSLSDAALIKDNHVAAAGGVVAAFDAVRATYPDLDLEGHVDSIQRGSGSKFSAFPAENATGNFIKIVQRVPVKIVIDGGLKKDEPLPLGISVEPTVMLK